jgi:pimeloyl-ACP methyl ester carboxylesterase
MPIRKELPRQTVQNLIPPREDYVYFEAPLEYPFQPLSTRFEIVNAGWLADASLLVYGDETFIRGRVAVLAAELPGVDVQVFAGPSTQALVLTTVEFVIVAFRGTRIEVFPDPIALWQRGRGAQVTADQPSGKLVFLNWRDVVSDVNFGMGPDGIHRGFRQALDQANLWEAIQSHLQTLSSRPVWFTGHSLGAALATIAAARHATLAPVQGMYTFGSPRVGNAAFAQTVPGQVYRVVNNNDIVARLPPQFAGFVHVGEKKFIDGSGNFLDDGGGDSLKEQFTRFIAALSRSAPQLIDDKKLQLPQFIARLRSLDVEVPDNALNDHAPANYACRIWNALSP